MRGAIRTQRGVHYAAVGAIGASIGAERHLDPNLSIDGFSYDEAFSRNIGWVTSAEQQQLRTKRVAIAGLGGVGGVHLLTLARLGVGAFNIADFDTFDLANFNRQAGALMSTLGRTKTSVMEQMGKDVLTRTRSADLSRRGYRGEHQCVPGRCRHLR